MTELDVAEAKTGELEFNLAWGTTDDAVLEGTLAAINVSPHPVRLTGKPGLRPLGADGEPLDTVTTVTLELVIPGYVVLQPGDRAVAPVGWAGWDGPAATGAVLVTWDGGEGQAKVQASGPPQPERTGPATNLWSSWFKPSG